MKMFLMVVFLQSEHKQICEHTSPQDDTSFVLHSVFSQNTKVTASHRTRGSKLLQESITVI